MLQAPLAVAYLDFGLYALALDAIEGIRAMGKADRGALLDIERMEDEARQSLVSRRLSWEKDRRALVALDEARWRLLAGHEEEALRKVASVLLERPLWIPALEELQEENLEDLDRAPAERRGPFAIRLIDLLPLSCKIATLWGPIGSNIEREHAIDDLIGMMRTKAGDLASIELIVDRLLAPWFPELDGFALAEANSPSFSKRRRELLRTFLERTAIGSDSESKEDAVTALRQWDISWEARVIPSPLQAEHERAFELLSSGDFSGAARMHASLADRAPREPSFKNNLRYALYGSGRKEEADRLGAEMRRDFPPISPCRSRSPARRPTQAMPDARTRWPLQPASLPWRRAAQYCQGPHRPSLGDAASDDGQLPLFDA